MALESERQAVYKFITSYLQPHFKEVNLAKRCRVEADLDKWRPEVEEIWQQKKDLAPKWFSIYFDDVFMCSFNTNDTPKEVELEFFKGFKEAYEQEKIYLDENQYIIKAELEAQKRKDEEHAKKRQLEKDLAKENISPLEKSIVEEVVKDATTK